MFYLHPSRSLALLTDLYELTMAYAYWKNARHEDEAVFHLFFRRLPFQGGYTIASGLASVIDYLKNWKIDSSDLRYLADLKTANGKPLFEEPFLEYLQTLTLSCDLDAVQEGEVLFAYEPLLRVQGPLLQAQLLESALLNLVNFPTLIATKAARICEAAGPTTVVEFGLRRAQGLDGAMTASRAAFIGGCQATSNTLAGKWLNIPVAGTHAHSWVMSYDDELESFEAYAAALPDHCVFLVDTYDSLTGVEHAIRVGLRLKERGHELLGIRLDSGDLTSLSQQARQRLDAAGMQQVKIYASNELNEHLIADMRKRGSQVAVWGVGTHLVTGQSQPALEGVYKLSAVKSKGASTFSYRLKLSEKMTKISDPGILQVRRFYDASDRALGDALYDVNLSINQDSVINSLQPPRQSLSLQGSCRQRDLLVPIFRKGVCVYDVPSIDQSQRLCKKELALFDQKVRSLELPASYPVGMESKLGEKKEALVAQQRAKISP